MNKKQKQLFIIIGVVAIILVILFFVILNKKDDNNTNKPIFGGNTDNAVEEDIKKDDEKGIVLTNLNNNFVMDAGKKTEAFMYEFSLNSERVNLKFENVVLNNNSNPAKLTIYVNEKEIDIMKTIKDATFKEPTSIIPKFYILGDKSDEVLLLEVTAIDSDIPYNTYIAINNNGEIRNSFGGYDNEKITDNEFLKAIKNGKLIYDHRISSQENDNYCACAELKKGNGLNKVISEKQIFSVLESSLKLDSNEIYECSKYCK